MSRRVSTLSTVHRGIAFEQRSRKLLQTHLSMALRRVGGRSDGGIDLVGWWWLPFATDLHSTHRPGALPDMNGLLRRRLRVIAQCKAEKKKFSPKYVREMEGVWHIHSRSSASLAAHSSALSTPPYESASPDVYPTVALLLSESPFSKSTVLHAYRSTVPFLLIHLPCSSSFPGTPTSAGDTEMGAVCPNPTLMHLVKPLSFCWERNPTASTPTEIDAYAGAGGRPGLWWQDRKLNSWAPDLPDSDAT